MTAEDTLAACGTIDERKEIAVAFTQSTAEALRTEAQLAERYQAEAEEALQRRESDEDLQYLLDRADYCRAKAVLARAMLGYIFIEQEGSNGDAVAGHERGAA
jgi:hypothetical protein